MRWLGGRRVVRAASVLAVAAVHVALVAMLLQTVHDRPVRRVVEGEHTIWLPPLPPPPQPSPRRDGARAGRLPFHPTYPDYRGITLPPDVFATQAPNLSRSLFDCAGRNVEALSPEQRAHCAGAPYGLHPGDGVDYRDHMGDSHDAALWARGRARKNEPLLLPCMSPQAAGISLGTLFCLAKGATEGFDLDNQPGYADTPEQIHVPNNGDPPDKPN